MGASIELPRRLLGLRVVPGAVPAFGITATETKLAALAEAEAALVTARAVNLRCPTTTRSWRWGAVALGHLG